MINHVVARPAEEHLVERAAAVCLDDLAPDVLDATLLVIFDTLGLASAGSQSPGVDSLLNAMRRFGPTDYVGSMPVPWTDLSLAPGDAALVLATLCHAWDFDETHDAALLHACASALPAALAAAWQGGAPGWRVVEGLVAGVEVASRIGLGMGPAVGVSKTQTCGVFGAAAAAARVLDLGPDGLRRALSIAVSLAGSTRQTVTDSATSKRLQPGFAARNGLLSAHLAAEGMDGPSGWLDGWAGLMSAAVPPAGWEARMDPAGVDTFEIERLSLKPYPACRSTHAAIQAAEIAQRSGVEHPESVVVHLPVSGNKLVSRPFEHRGQPIMDAQFSIPWLVAATLLDGRVDLTTVGTARVSAEDIAALAARVEVHNDVESNNQMTPLELRVTDQAGAVHTTRVDDVLGSPEMPLSWELVDVKLRACAQVGGHDPAKVSRLRDAVHALPREEHGAHALLAL